MYSIFQDLLIHSSDTQTAVWLWALSRPMIAGFIFSITLLIQFVFIPSHIILKINTRYDRHRPTSFAFYFPLLKVGPPY